MDEQTLRHWLARQMKIDRVPNPVWEDADENGYVADAQRDGKEGREELLYFARQRLDFSDACKTGIKDARYPVIRKRLWRSPVTSLAS
jgi:hypothetical protein